jgi:hypothetical protein
MGFTEVIESTKEMNDQIDGDEDQLADHQDFEEFPTEVFCDGAHAWLKKLVSVHPEIALFHKLSVNLRDCLCPAVGGIRLRVIP